VPFLDRDRARIHYEVHGNRTDRPPLLLSHGFSASAQMWERNIGALARDRQVLAWDMCGHARSSSPQDASAYGVEESVDDMLALLDVLDASRAVLGGMSLGGYLSLAFHARHPGRVAALILVDTGPGFRREEPRERWNELAEHMATALDRDGAEALAASPEVAQHRDLTGLVHTARRVMAQRDAHVIDSLPRIAVPTLVVVGERDINFLAAADYMAAKIPDARKLVLEGAGHAANIEAPDAFIAAVREFLEHI
jgi:pimeloyl-ACP methyl ester carboxylesterase